MSGVVCILTDEVLESIGMAPECANCTDASWYYRDEQPIVNDKGIKFCSVECADEAETRWEREAAWRASDWCAECGFDKHEHQDWCGKS